VNGYADSLVLQNGETLKGKMVKVEKGAMIFQSDMLGEQKIDLGKIKNFSTDAPATIHLQDGTVISSKISADTPGRFKTEKTSLLAGQSFALADIKALNPPPKPKPKWSGSITAGYTSTHGNTYAESGSVSFDATIRKEKTRDNVYSRYLISRQKDAEKNKQTTEESFLFGGKHDHFFSKKMYGFLAASFKKDHVADLDRRIIGTAGLGYQWIESDPTNFSTDVGLAFVHEKYITRVRDVDGPDPNAYITVEDSSDNLSLSLGYHFDHKINDKTDFIHNLTYYPSLEQVSDYYLTTDAELRWALTTDWFSSIKAIFDYDSTPPEGNGSTDTKYIFSLGYTF
jgi:putative salt-induced outer membrane protein YdiY